jgi:16S rRNA (cytosine1402-N4)-methyltransferase
MSNEQFRMHIPVLLNEVLKYLNPKPNENFVDCTFGQGGHSLKILEKIKPKGKILGIETDEELFEKMKSKVKEKRLILVKDSYKSLEKIIKNKKFGPVKGILFDLGLSSWHLEESKRGFSFKKDEILDMRYDLKNPLTAKKILNEWQEKEIEKILREYGQESFADRIAREILKRRPIEKTFQLVEAIKEATPGWYKKRKIHFATKTFQALRIAVNDELENLKSALPQALKILGKDGRLVVISFHSLEDKIVKNFLKENSKKGLIQILTKKPIRPSQEEIKKNPRARSAKLRAAIKT